MRGYRRYEEGPVGKVVPIQASRSPSPKRKSPFAKEMALLRSLGLRWLDNERLSSDPQPVLDTGRELLHRGQHDA